MRVAIASIPNWEFHIDEVSPSFHKLRAIHTLGSSIEMSGIDEERLLSEARVTAQKMESEIGEKVS